MKDVKSSKKNTLTDGLIEKTSSMIDAAASKTVQRRGKRRKALSEVKPLENKNKNQQSFLEACRYPYPYLYLSIYLYQCISE